ncbi:unnamed protein product, partial [Mesorhabditis spiculigera]
MGWGNWFGLKKKIRSIKSLRSHTARAVVPDDQKIQYYIYGITDDELELYNAEHCKENVVTKDVPQMIGRVPLLDIDKFFDETYENMEGFEWLRSFDTSKEKSDDGTPRIIAVWDSFTIRHEPVVEDNGGLKSARDNTEYTKDDPDESQDKKEAKKTVDRRPTAELGEETANSDRKEQGPAAERPTKHSGREGNSKVENKSRQSHSKPKEKPEKQPRSDPGKQPRSDPQNEGKVKANAHRSGKTQNTQRTMKSPKTRNEEENYHDGPAPTQEEGGDEEPPSDKPSGK